VQKQELDKLRTLLRGKGYNRYIIYEANSQVIYLSIDCRSAFNLGRSLKTLDKLCAEENIEEVLILKNDSNAELLNEFLQARKNVPKLG